MIKKHKFLDFDIQLFADGEITYKVAVDGKEAERTIRNLSKSSDRLSKKFTSFGTKMTVGVTAPLTALATAGVKYNASMETYLANLTTLLGGNQQEAQKLLNTLKEMANTTPYETTTLVGATQKMMAFGISAEDSLKYLQMLGDIAMGDANKMDSLTLAFSQISASGRASMEDINQMIDQGFNPLTVIAEKTGESMGDLRDRVSAGGVSFEEIAGAFETATSKGGTFYQSMDKASQTTEGKISSLKDAFSSSLGEMTKALLPFITDAVEGLTKVANWFSNLDNNGKKVVLTLAGIALAIGPVSSGIGGLIKIGEGISKLSSKISKLKNGFSKFSGVVSKGATGLKSFTTAIGKTAINFGKLAIQTALATAKLVAQKAVMLAQITATKLMTAAQWLLNAAMSANPITLIIIAITAVIAAIVLLWNKCEWFRNAVMSVIMFIWNLIKTYVGFYITIFKGIWNAILWVINKIKNGFSTAVNFLKSLFNRAVNFYVSIFKKIWSGVSWVINKIKSGFSYMADKVKSIFNGIKDTISSIMNKVIGVVKTPINWAISGLNTLIGGINKIPGINIPKIPALATGTNYIQREGLAYLHEGEAVVPKKYNPAIGGYGSHNQPIYVTVNADMDVNKFGKAFVKDIKTFSGGAKNSYNYGGSK